MNEAKVVFFLVVLLFGLVALGLIGASILIQTLTDWKEYRDKKK